MKILDLLKQKSTLSTLEQAQTQARLDLAQAVENLDAARDKEESSLLAADENIALASAKLVEVEAMRLRRAQAALDAISERIEQAQSDEAESRRKVKFKNAKRESEEALADLIKIDGLNQEYIRILGKVASAVLAVEAVNADLPADAGPLMRPDNIAAGARPHKVMEEREIVEWFAPDASVPLSAEEAERVEDLGDGTGRLAPAPKSGGGYVGRTVPLIVKKRVRTQVTFLPSTEFRGQSLPVSAATRLVSSAGVEIWNGWAAPERIIAESGKAIERIRAAKVTTRDEREVLSHILD